MIPATYHFKDIDCHACIHPGVAAEIAEARRRDGVENPSRLQALAAVLRRLVPGSRPRPDWSRVPAE